MLSHQLKVAMLAISLLLSLNVMAHGFGSPQEAVNSYITAVKTGSGEHVKMAFLESASIQYYGEDGSYKNYTRDAFAELVDTGNKWNAAIEITDVKVSGNAANATVEFSWGEKGKKGYVDYLNLINHNGSWHITDKVAQYIER